MVKEGSIVVFNGVKVLSVAPKVAKGATIFGVIGIGADVAEYYLAKNKHKELGMVVGVTGNVVSFGGTGALIGAPFGGIGAPIGAGIGGVIGACVWGLGKLFGGSDDKKP